MKKIIIFASGNGSNAENIVLKIKELSDFSVAAIFTNNPRAKVIERAHQLDIICHVFTKNQLNSGLVSQLIAFEKPDLIVLAGFLWKVPESLTAAYPNQIINIHPALLPKYGGKGMYGHHVHEAVLANGEKETGITIHYVNEHYDEGQIIFQKSVDISPCQTADEIATKVQDLEYEYFPKVVLELLNKL
jgi:phosphoribosylglycinamide formyltransferase-1